MIFAACPTGATLVITLITVVAGAVKDAVLDGVAGTRPATVEMASTPAAAEAVRAVGLVRTRLVPALAAAAAPGMASTAAVAAAAAMAAAVLGDSHPDKTKWRPGERCHDRGNQQENGNAAEFPHETNATKSCDIGEAPSRPGAVPMIS